MPKRKRIQHHILKRKAQDMKPSDFPWDQRFLNPRTPAFRSDDGTYHVFSYDDAVRILRNDHQEFTREPYWLPEAQREHPSLNFMWMIEPLTMGGEEGRHNALRGIVEPWFRTRAVRTMEPVIREITLRTHRPDYCERYR